LKNDGDKQTGLNPLTIALALGASAGVWLVVEFLSRRGF
jgi:hypothetical protein